MPRKRKSGAGIGRRRRRRPKIRSYPSIHSKRPSGRKIKSASRIVKRKSVPQQDDNSAPPFKKMKTDRQFLPFEEAKRVVHALGLKNYDDWSRWSRTKRPPEIPSAPWRSYKNAGWNGLEDWLGKKKRPVFLPYEEAKKVVNALGLKNQDDWKRWSCTKRPSDIPGNPWISYKNAGWNGFADWLGQPNEQIYTYVIEGIIIDEIVKLGY